MRALVVHQPGGPQAMRLQQLPAPQPGPGQVVVAVEAVGINPWTPATAPTRAGPGCTRSTWWATNWPDVRRPPARMRTGGPVSWCGGCCRSAAPAGAPTPSWSRWTRRWWPRDPQPQRGPGRLALLASRLPRPTRALDRGRPTRNAPAGRRPRHPPRLRLRQFTLLTTVRVPETPEVTMTPLNVSLPVVCAAAGAAIARAIPAASRRTGRGRAGWPRSDSRRDRTSPSGRGLALAQVNAGNGHKPDVGCPTVLFLNVYRRD
jgi:hypothetical protein